MAEDIQKPLNLKKSFLKKDNEEEPIIVAQRFLNIFRQLHIFTTERKEAFNTMILDLPPEIRGMFSSLPGGSVLQEYVDDLEQKSGMIRDKTSGVSSEISEEISKAKILATAMAEAQIAAANKIQQTQAPAPQPQQTQPERVSNVSQETRAPVSERIVADSSFAKEIASAVKEAIMYTESNRKKENDEITKVLAASQAKLAQIVMQNNSAASSNSSNNNANNIQINTAATFPPIEEMVSGIVRAQSELFREMAKTQTAELSAIISVALKESQQLSTQTIVEAIKAFQKENLKVLGLRAATRDFEEDEITPQVKVKQKKTETPKIVVEPIEEIEDIEEAELDEEIPEVIEETSSEIIEDAPKKKKKKKKKKKNKSAVENLSVESPVIPSPEKYEYIVAKTIDNLPVNNSDSDNEWEWEYEAAPLEELPKEISDNNLDVSLFDNEINELKASNKSLDLSIFDDETPQLAENKETSEDDFEWAYEEVEIEENTPLEPTIEAKIEETTQTESSEEEWEWEYEPETIEEAPDPIDNIILAEENENIQVLDFNVEFDDEVEQIDSEEETISNQTSALTTNNFGFSNKEDDLDSFSSSLDTDKATTDLDFDEELETTEDNAFNFSEIKAEIETPTELKLETETVNETETKKSGEEWEWEYEKVEEEALLEEPVQIIETAATETTTEENEEEWEWEYEEVEEKAHLDPVQVVEAVATETSTEESEEEWEWEYEEIVEKTPLEPVQVIEVATTEAKTEESKEEWEWEYEEVEEEVPLEPVQVEKDNSQNNLTNSFGLSDPYQNLITDKDIAANEENATTNLSAIYTGEVYFQEDVLSTEQSKTKETKEFNDLIDAEIGIPELNKDDNNEPYKPKII